jgi:Rrf2 family protein
MALARRYQQGPIRVREIASDGDLPAKFLELILIELKNARIVESIRGAKGGYRLRRAPAEIQISEIIRVVDGTLAPFGDADQLRSLVARDLSHRALYQVFLDVRDTAATILENTTVADLVSTRESPRIKSRQHRLSKKRKQRAV